MSQIHLIETEDLKQTLKEVVAEVLSKSNRGPIPPAKQWLNRRDVKEILGVSDAQLQYLRDSRQIPFSQFGRKIIYKADDIEAFLIRHRVEATKRESKERP